MTQLPGPIEWDGPHTVLVRYTSLPRGLGFPHGCDRGAAYLERPGRSIASIYVHQTGGGFDDGVAACERAAEWDTLAPRLERIRGRTVRVGGGRGLPGVRWTFLVPHRPDVHRGKSVVYRLWTDEWMTWHTRRHNRTGVSVAFAGTFATRHSPRLSDRDPTSSAIAAGEELIRDYLLPRYGLTADDVLGHFDAGRPTCPGDVLEAWVRRQRGETVSWLTPTETTDRRPLETRAQQADALAALGFGATWNLRSREGYRLAVEAVQEEAEVPIDGAWGMLTEAAVRRLLGAL